MWCVKHQTPWWAFGRKCQRVWILSTLVTAYETTPHADPKKRFGRAARALPRPQNLPQATSRARATFPAPHKYLHKTDDQIFFGTL